MNHRLNHHLIRQNRRLSHHLIPHLQNPNQPGWPWPAGWQRIIRAC
jgi:hypothetical protein